MVAPVSALLQQLSAALAHYNDLQVRATVEDQSSRVSPVQYERAAAFATSAVTAIENATGRNSSRSQMAREYAEDYRKAPVGHSPAKSPAIAGLKGIVDDTHTALLKGYLVSYQELIHGEVFSDFLEMAEHLLAEGCKDPAAVIAGTSLELHLKRLCARHGVPVADKAAKINDDLKRQSVYGGVEHKQVIAWQQLRNDAAHGNYDTFDAAQVALMIQGVRDFVAKYPA